MTNTVTLSGLTSFIREWFRIPPEQAMSSETLLETDLGITGDDGCDLLAAVEREYGISFVGSDGTCREAFGLNCGKFLFHGEGFFAMNFEKNVARLSVGQLFDAILKAQAQS